ncbi:hypothetical protein MTO96_034283 [Rhipicephalus appendiculatus]
MSDHWIPPSFQYSDYISYSSGFPTRIRHFGCLRFTLGLDRYTADSDYKNLKAIFPVFKKFQQGDPTGKTVLALGLRTRNEPRATQYNLSDYESLLKEFAEIPSIDILVSITSTSTLNHRQFVLPPPSVTNVTNDEYLTLEEANQFFSPSSSYGHKNITFGVSLEFGATASYWNATTHWDAIQPFDNLTDYIFYFTKSPDKACGAPAKTRKHFPAVNIWGSYTENQTWATYYLYETNDTLHDKVSYVRSQRRRDTFAWLIYNIHQVASSSNCEWDPYYVLKLLKGEEKLAHTLRARGLWRRLFPLLGIRFFRFLFLSLRRRLVSWLRLILLSRLLLLFFSRLRLLFLSRL